MPNQVEQYSLLVSCPGDIEEEVNIVYKVVDEFNNRFSKYTGISILVKHWSKNSYSQSGGKPQDLLNNQFVNDCDAAVALFWTRFGTPTDKYGSGTEEEISLMIDSGKQVFMYFSDKPLPPSKADSEGYKKVQLFKEKYKVKGLFGTYSSNEEFEEMFRAHLEMYFLGLAKQEDRFPKLVLKGINKSEKLTEEAYVYPYTMPQCYSRDSFSQKAEQLLRRIDEIVVPDESKQEVGYGINFNLDHGQKISISDQEVDEIKEVANVLDYAISESFFYLDGLKQDSLRASMYGEQRLIGSKEAKTKYCLIQELLSTISDWLSWAPIINEFTNLSFIKLALQNEGTKVDEDIEISLSFPKESVLDNNDFPTVDNDTMGVLTEDNNIFTLFGISATKDYDEYSTKNPKPISFSIENPLYGTDYSEEYLDTLDSVFDYSFFRDDQQDTIKVKIDYLKHHKAMAFPSVIFLKRIPKEIAYEITSKNNSEVIEGVLKVIDSTNPSSD